MVEQRKSPGDTTRKGGDHRVKQNKCRKVCRRSTFTIKREKTTKGRKSKEQNKKY